MNDRRITWGGRQRAVLRAAGVTPLVLFLPVAVGVVTSASHVGTALVNSLIFAELLGERSPSVLTRLIGVLSALLIVTPLLGLLRGVASNRVGLLLKTSLRRAILAEIDRRGPMRLSSSRAGGVESMMVDGVEAIEPYFGTYLPQIAVTTLTAGALCVWIAITSPLIGAVLFACAVVTFLIPRLWDRALAEEGQAHWTAYEELNSDVVDAMMGMTTLKAFGASERYGERLARRSRELLRTTLTQLRVSLGETGASAAVMVLGPALALLLGFLEASRGAYPVDRLFFIALLSVEVFRPLRELASAFHAGYFGLSAATEIHAAFNGVPTTEPPRPRGSLPESTLADITAEELSYSYEGATERALDGVSLDVRQGELLAVVGGSGSGKSTLLGLLLGLDVPSSGSIVIGGIPSSELDAPSVVSLVPQESVIFPGTVEEILRGAAPGATRDDELRALTIAGAYGFHDRESTDRCDDADGRATDEDLLLAIEEGGANLSGGQRQRLAIARALVRSPRVLILDESTSALDSRLEMTILRRIRERLPGTTLILVTHRMEVAQLADDVLVLRHGRGVELGAPSDLVEAGGEFSRMVDSTVMSTTDSTAESEGT